MKRNTLIVIFLISTLISFANGGSIAKGGFIKGSNTIKLISEEDFKLNREDLYFHIQDDYINVMAIYLIENLGNKKDIKYGFAIDYRDNPKSNNYGWETDYITDFKLISNDTELKYVISDEKNVKIDSIDYNKRDVMTAVDTISRKWYISDLTFESRETRQLVVEYRIKTSFADWPMLSGYTENYPSTPDSDRKFSYFLKPSGFWGNGNVGKFRLTVSFDNIEKYKKIKIKGIKYFEKEDGIYVFECNNYSLLDNGYIKISYNYLDWESSLNARRFANHNIIKEVKSSSKHPKYPVSNLFDGNKNTAYITLPNDGKNDWIEVVFKEHVVFFGVGILNGYTKNNKVYLNNNIVTRLRLTLNPSKGSNHAPIVRDVELKRKNSENDFSIYFIGMEDLLMGEFFGDKDVGDNISDLMSSMGSLKIEILETDKGIKYDDTCISELMLYGAIDPNR